MEKKGYLNFQNKLLIAFMICSIVPLLILGKVLYQTSYTIALDSLLNSTLLSDYQLYSKLDSIISQADSVSDSLQYSLYYIDNVDGSRAYSDLNKLRSNINIFKEAFRFSHISVFFPETKKGTEEGIYFFPLSMLNQYNINTEELDTIGVSSVWFVQKELSLPYIISDTNKKFDMLGCLRILKDRTSKKTEYAHIIWINMEDIKKYIYELYPTPEIECFLLDDSLENIVGKEHLNLSDFDGLSSDIVKEESQFRFQNDHYHSMKLSNGWILLTKITDSYIRENVNVLMLRTILTILIIIPLVFMIVIALSKSLSKRIGRLAKQIENFEIGKDSNYVPVSSAKDNLYFEDEIDILNQKFSDMVESLNENIESIFNLSLSEERLKYQLLQSQINPHFLYNILATIKSCQNMGRIDTANKMIDSLTKFYRMSLRKSEELIPIRDEIEIATLYLEMEALCRNDSLSWKFEIEDGIENFLICRFTLQPFLENSIQHGYSASHETIHIDMKAIYMDDTIVITIIDNGAGMTQEQLASLKKTLANQEVDYKKHFGIGNVNKRISSKLFGNGQVRIESSLHQGTQVTIEFRQITEDER